MMRMKMTLSRMDGLRIAIGATVAVLLVVSLFQAAGCKRGGPTEPEPTIVGTWAGGGLRKTYGEDGSYSAKLYGSSFNISEKGTYTVVGDRLRIQSTQYNSGTACASGCTRTWVSIIKELTNDTLVLETYGYQITYKRV